LIAKYEIEIDTFSIRLSRLCIILNTQSEILILDGITVLEVICYAFCTTGVWSSKVLLFEAIIPHELSSM